MQNTETVPWFICSGAETNWDMFMSSFLLWSLSRENYYSLLKYLERMAQTQNYHGTNFEHAFRIFKNLSKYGISIS